MSRPKLTPEIAYNLAMRLFKASGERDERLEAAIAKDPMRAGWYARYVLKGPWPKGEPAIAQDAYYAYGYASNVLEGPFPEAESVIAQDRIHARLYKNLLRTPEDHTRFKEILS